MPATKGSRRPEAAPTGSGGGTSSAALPYPVRCQNRQSNSVRSRKNCSLSSGVRFGPPLRPACGPTMTRFTTAFTAARRRSVFQPSHASRTMSEAGRSPNTAADPVSLSYSLRALSIRASSWAGRMASP